MSRARRRPSVRTAAASAAIVAVLGFSGGVARQVLVMHDSVPEAVRSGLGSAAFVAAGWVALLVLVPAGGERRRRHRPARSRRRREP